MSEITPLEILLVEDNPGDVELIQVGLRNGKISNNLNVVEDGVEAMLYLQRKNSYSNSKRPDLILLDINLPKKNGHDVLLEIRNNPELKLLPVIILTTSDQDRDILQSYSNHVNAYITKPVKAEDFLNVVKTIEDFWLTLVRLPSR